MTCAQRGRQALATAFACCVLVGLRSATAECERETTYDLHFNFAWTSDVDSGIPNVDPTIFVGFSRIVCVSHSSSYVMWQPDELASDSLLAFIKDKNIKPLLNELENTSNSVLEHGKSEDDAMAESDVKMSLTVDGRRNATLISCFANIIPSPGWFVGLSGEDVCGDDGNYNNSFTVTLEGWNSGRGVPEEDAYMSELNISNTPGPIKFLLGYSSKYGDVNLTNRDPPTDSSMSDGASSCFPSGELIALGSGEYIPVQKLQMGDSVRSPHGGTSSIYMFSHFDADAISVFLELQFLDGPRHSSLRVSPGHYIYRFKKSLDRRDEVELVVAQDVKRGERLVGHDGLPRVLTRVSRVTGRGLYNPHSTDGDLVVSGLRVSSYTSAVEPAVASVALSPLRVLHRMGLRLLSDLVSYRILCGSWNQILSDIYNASF